jgi:drug/metabolite transporter (DMT)-like permease
MVEGTQRIILGVSLLAGGVFLLARYKSLARRVAEGMKDTPLARWPGFDSSEEFFRGLYGFAGVFMILSGLIPLVGAASGEPGSTSYVICDYVVRALLAGIFGGGLAFILYSNWRSGNRRKMK